MLAALRRNRQTWLAEHYLNSGSPDLYHGAAHTVWRSTGTPQSGPRHLAAFHNRCEQQVRDALGDEQFTAAFQHGTRLTPDQTIDYAIEDTSEQATTVQPAPAPTDRPPC
jgi:non-specific serine/threonine protein kinase